MQSISKTRRERKIKMKKKTEQPKPKDELRREYGPSELKIGVRGKYASRYKKGPIYVNSRAWITD